MKSFRASATDPVSPGAAATARPASALLAVLALLAIAPLLLSGCLAKSAPKPPGAPPSAEGPAMDLARALRDQGVSTMATRGSVEYSANNSNHYFRFELLSQQPDRFLFTILDPLGRPAVKIVSDGRQFMALEFGPRTATFGGADSGVLTSYLPLGLTAGDFIQLLSGALIPEPERASLSGRADGDAALTVIPGGAWTGSTWRLSLSSGENGPRINAFSVNFDKEPPISAVYGHHSPQTIEDQGRVVDFPDRLDLKWGQNKSLLVRHDEVRLGFPAQPPSLFAIAAPDGFTRVDL
jgi:hypothetical protein